jgi:hypothetical protein
MAKQTFTTGQVLTAAQMTSLQQTAMGGGAATAKTASYVLVAADAGTTVAMNAAGATTITVNTGLFAAGDTVFIQNLGAGACTVTAGTATVATAGSLILPQNDAGILYFTATGTAIFYDYIQAGAVSPLTTKGDVYTFSTSDARLGVGANNTVLTADSAEATGLKWATPSGSGASFTLLNSGDTTIGTSSSKTWSGISGINTLFIVIKSIVVAANSPDPYFRVNGNTGSVYNIARVQHSWVSTYAATNYVTNSSFSATRVELGSSGGTGGVGGACNGGFQIFGANTANHKMFTVMSGGNANTVASQKHQWESGFITDSAVISSITILDSGGNNFSSGDVYIYGSAV